MKEGLENLLYCIKEGWAVILFVIVIPVLIIMHFAIKEAEHNDAIEQQAKVEEARQHKQELQAMVKEAVREEMEKQRRCANG
jgi:predicted Holliday junction resolvase-like endonuclease